MNNCLLRTCSLVFLQKHFGKINQIRKLAEISIKKGGVVLLGENIHEQTRTYVKVNKIEGEENIFTVSRVVKKNEEKNQDFIKKFLEREGDRF